jgi:short-subunit dehydrogenase
MGARDFDLEKFRNSVDVNIMGTATALAAVMPGMIARGAGQIAITSSVAGYFGMPMAAAYGVTKAALISLAESLKFDLDALGVMMNVICPGFVRTPMTDTNQFPMPFIIEPDEAARIITRGLRTGGFEIVFPRRMAVTMKLARALPYALFFAAVGAVVGGQGSRRR